MGSNPEKLSTTRDSQARGAKIKHGDGGVQQTLFGKVVSDASSKTIVVLTRKQSSHPRYAKQISKTEKYHAHDPNEEARVGDIVEIRACRPRSKMKRWELVGIVQSSRDRRSLWNSLQLALSARIRNNTDSTGTARSFIVVLQLQPRQSALFLKTEVGQGGQVPGTPGGTQTMRQQTTPSKRTVQVVIQLTGNGITAIRPNLVKIDYSVRNMQSTEALVNFEVTDDPSPFMQAAILVDRTLVEVKRFALESIISGVRPHGN